MNIKATTQIDYKDEQQEITTDVASETEQFYMHITPHFSKLQKSFHSNDELDMYISLNSIKSQLISFKNAVLQEDIFEKYEIVPIIFSCLESTQIQIVFPTLEILCILFQRINIDNIVQFLENNNFHFKIHNILDKHNIKSFKLALACINVLFKYQSIGEFILQSFDLHEILAILESFIQKVEVTEFIDAKTEVCKLIYNLVDFMESDILIDSSLRLLSQEIETDSNSLLVWILIKVLQKNQEYLLRFSQTSILDKIYEGIHSSFTEMKTSCLVFLYYLCKFNCDPQILRIDELLAATDENTSVKDLSCIIFCLNYFLENNEISIDLIIEFVKHINQLYEKEFNIKQLSISLMITILNSQTLVLDDLIDNEKMDAFTWIVRGLEMDNIKTKLIIIDILQKIFNLAVSLQRFESVQQIFFEHNLNDLLDQAANEEDDEEFDEKLDVFKQTYFHSE